MPITACLPCCRQLHCLISVAHRLPLDTVAINRAVNSVARSADVPNSFSKCVTNGAVEALVLTHTAHFSSAGITRPRQCHWNWLLSFAFLCWRHGPQIGSVSSTSASPVPFHLSAPCLSVYCQALQSNWLFFLFFIFCFFHCHLFPGPHYVLLHLPNCVTLSGSATAVSLGNPFHFAVWVGPVVVDGTVTAPLTNTQTHHTTINPPILTDRPNLI